MLSYHTRIFQAYLGRGTSQLSFWHERPEVNEPAFAPDSRQYYMTFAGKARYAGPFDAQGIPLLDYRGRIGRQYNPIAIAQYGLGCWNEREKKKVEGGRWKVEGARLRQEASSGDLEARSAANVEYRISNGECRSGAARPDLPDTPAENCRSDRRSDPQKKSVSDNSSSSSSSSSTAGEKIENEHEDEGRGRGEAAGRAGGAQGSPPSTLPPPPAADLRHRFLACADWLVEHLEKNPAGLHVWMHHFDWEYFRPLKAPWYSGLAQGQGISLLARAFAETGDVRFREAADRAMEPLLTETGRGGTLFVDPQGDWWIEEYLTEPPTHILNGFIWALWGVHDYGRWLGAGSRWKDRDRELWDKGLATLERNLGRYDCGYWSLYDQAATGLRNPASAFYHRLHIVQMAVMALLTERETFREFGAQWRGYEGRALCRWRALAHKAVFKLVYY